MAQRSVTITPRHSYQGNADATVFTPDDDGRLTLVIYTGAASIHLRPTAAEARELIAALQWALEPAEQLTGEVAA